MNREIYLDSALTKDPEDLVIKVGKFYNNLIIDETSVAWYARYRDIYENRMADLPHANRIIMLLHEVNRTIITYTQPIFC